MSLEIARTHYSSLKRYLYQHLLKEKHGVSAQRKSARDKLVRLTQQQFQELSTDVYDELTRREANDPHMPHLPVKDEFHPKRNQARQKLATLPKTRFKDLASDVFAELDRRYPQFGRETASPVHAYGVSSTGPSPPQSRSTPQPAGSSNTSTNGANGHYGGGGNQRRVGGSPDAVEMDSPIMPNRPYNHQRSETPTSHGTNTGVVVPDRGEAVMVDRTSLNYTVHARQGSNGPSVNFDSLDDLMSEMEGMVKKKKMEDATMQMPRQQQPAMRNGHSHTDSAVTRMKDEYELKLKMLRQQIQDLEGRLAATVDDVNATRLRSLEEQVVSYQEADYNRLQRSYDEVKKELEQQQQNSGNLQEETAALMASIRELSLKNEDIVTEREEYEATVKELSDENKKLRRQLEEMRREMRAIKGKSTSTYIRENPKVDFAENNILTPTSDGVLEQAHITSFQLAVDSLLRAIRQVSQCRWHTSETANQCLLAMKSVVMACKGMLQDIEVYQQSNRPGPDRGVLPEAKTRLGTSLNILVTAVRNHVTAGGVSPPSIVDSAASDTTGVVVDLVRALHINAATAKSNVPNSFSNSSVNLTSINEERDEHNGMPNGYGYGRQSGANTPTHGDESKHSRSGSMQAGSHYQSVANNASVYDIEDLKAIHELLGLIRAPRADPEELSETVVAIRDTVNDVISASRRTFCSQEGAAFRMDGEQVLANLEQSNIRLCELRDSYPASGQADKPAKQALAGASFEIAKHTKELVALIEEGTE
ncbi:hypothetical protein THASP1DRAFT_23809 [Thamnocephalis sphaerospora]|uniref:GIT Spa2 homology (SHD) domain-containing protein n=1 Tax=Thamnocephalis sphaerospora TaxID=78915 RepID=A0A4P9XQ50_9FUNG|nr:hypothetical protein THASP1DRAFT_23809 [Thamnocephalis sphaerospora]|eukprot:RKP08146.1 hypothetical protein THASP1DRAFT_23809 [Thamnocephalis sphaerospora]